MRRPTAHRHWAVALAGAALVLPLTASPVAAQDAGFAAREAASSSRVGQAPAQQLGGGSSGGLAGFPLVPRVPAGQCGDCLRTRPLTAVR